jgi:hypothetical protein
VPAANSGLHDLDAAEAFYWCWFALEGAVAVAQSPSEMANAAANNSGAGVSIVHNVGTTGGTYVCTV